MPGSMRGSHISTHSERGFTEGMNDDDDHDMGSGLADAQAFDLRRNMPKKKNRGNFRRD